MAKRFHFPLATLLRMRELHEREAKRKVGEKLAEIAQLDQANQQADNEIRMRQSDLLASQRTGTIATTDIARTRGWITHLRHTILQRQDMRAARVKELEVLQAELRVARKNKRIIEKLRDRRWEEYRKDLQRREQAQADELAQQLHAPA